MSKPLGYGIGIVMFAVLVGAELRRQGATAKAAIGLSVTLFASLMMLFISG